MLNKLFPSRFSLLKTFIVIFLTLSFAVRLILFAWSFSEADTSVFNLIYTFLLGFLFDIGTVSFFAFPYALYLLVMPSRFHGSILDKVVTYFGYSLGLIIFLFSFFAEITFWEEFKRRFNFIAVDYLIYTNEVVKNINESYPIPLLVGIILIAYVILLFVTKKRGSFSNTFKSTTPFKSKIFPTLIIGGIMAFFWVFVQNQDSEQFSNRYNNELSKTGIYSFFAAFRNNELPYVKFYKTIDENKAFTILKNKLKSEKEQFIHPDKHEILRTVTNSDSLKTPIKPNVVFICIESLSGKFLNSLGSSLNITPNIDSLANNGLFFNNLFATGTRTVRGMEAITLSISPTPGRSIVKRKNNQGLMTIGEVFRKEGYNRTFFYGGDGYFDNMNTYFGGNGFDIVDRGRGFLLDASITTKRTNIEDDEVTFENAWGVCDEDIYNKVIKEADKTYQDGKPFFDFVMTTSNHRPYTYPEGKVAIPSGTGREGAVQYTDYAIGEFLNKAKSKPWFNNTIFVIMADHCASSAGRWELDVQNYHIPAIVYNPNLIAPQNIDKLCSQIDIFPTVFGLLNWDYTSNFFGKDILKMKAEDERALIGNYRKLGLLKNNKLMVLNEQKESDFYQWNKDDNSLNKIQNDTNFLDETISYYQVADYLYRNDGLKIKE
ncbi:sulfatase [Yeosuana aromativorans]|uniref:Sulfatase n=1 Tax=Yeosuana aromativorans TaxID=288019 RepID=A0A8J3FH61_9FLAO|nr:alkaline phosphatase family protein [Yeosuana aromativorans]GGK24835.1 sulfatase [Yeosuana aromativorans]